MSFDDGCSMHLLLMLREICIFVTSRKFTNEAFVIRNTTALLTDINGLRKEDLSEAKCFLCDTNLEEMQPWS